MLSALSPKHVATLVGLKPEAFSSSREAGASRP
jgi:hypothetical protein